MGDPSSQPYPVAAGLVPNAVAQLSAGPSGHALATMAWPGPLAGNAGSLVSILTAAGYLDIGLDGVANACGSAPTPKAPMSSCSA